MSDISASDLLDAVTAMVRRSASEHEVREAVARMVPDPTSALDELTQALRRMPTAKASFAAMGATAVDADMVEASMRRPTSYLLLVAALWVFMVSLPEVNNFVLPPEAQAVIRDLLASVGLALAVQPYLDKYRRR